MSSGHSIYYPRSSMFELPLKDWFLYLYLMVSPLYMFAIVSDKDWPALWVLLAMALMMVVEFVRNGGRLWVDRSFLYLWLFLTVYVASTLIVYFSDSPLSLMGRDPVERAFTTMSRLIYVIFAYVVFVNFLADGTEKTFRRIFAVQMSIGVLIALFGIVQYISVVFLGSNALTEIEPTNESYRLYSSYSGHGAQRFFRAAAFFSEPSAFGFFLVPFFVKAFVARTQGYILGGKIMHALIILTFVIAMLFNLSMTAIMSTVILVSLYGLYSLKGSGRLWKFGALFGLIVGVIVVTPAGLLVVQRLDRVIGLADVSTLDRLFRVYVGLQVFISNPIIGVGPGGFAFQYPLFGQLVFGGLATPLNVWVTFLTDAGILGLVPFVLFLANVIRRGLRARQRHRLVTVYLWSIFSLLILLTTLDAWYWETLWFETAMLVGLASSAFLEQGPGTRSLEAT